MIELPVKNETSYVPVTELILYVSEECNLRCTYCFVPKKPRSMTLQTGEKTIDYFLNNNISGAASLLNLSFFGGEPMLETDLISQLIDYARKPRDRVYKKFRFGATTNGTLAGPKVENVVRKGEMQLLISLDGDAVASVDRPLVSGASSYPMIAKNLRKLLEWSPRSLIRMTYHPGSLDVIRNIEHAIELGAEAIALCPVVEADWNGLEEKVEELHQGLADWFLAEFRQGRVPPLEITWYYLRRYYRSLNCSNCYPQKPCAVAQQLLSVNVDGAVMPCHRYLKRPQDWLGTVQDDVLPPERAQYLKLHSSNFQECKTCPANRVCGGSCRIVTMESGYGFHGIHPHHCLITLAHYRAVKRIYRELHTDSRFLLYLNAQDRLSGALRELSTSSI